MNTQMCSSTSGPVMLEQHLARLTHCITLVFFQVYCIEKQAEVLPYQLLLLVICLPTTVPRFRSSIISVTVSRLFLLILFIVAILQTYSLAQVVYKPKQYLK